MGHSLGLTTGARALVLVLTGIEGTGVALPPPDVAFVGEGRVWRRSSTKNARGIDTPPFQDAVVNFTFFPTEPRVGDKVTVVPDNGVPPFDLSIQRIVRHDIPELERPLWEAQLEPVQAGPLLTAPPRADRDRVSIGVIVLYPAVQGVRGMSPSALDPASLPSASYLDLVDMAADLDADGSPDVLVVEYCCKGSGKHARNGCADYDDYVCGDTFLKKSGVWEHVRKRRPF